MMKKIYVVPEIKVVQLQQQCHVMAGSPPVSVTGLGGEPPLIFDELGELPGNAW